MGQPKRVWALGMSLTAHNIHERTQIIAIYGIQKDIVAENTKPDKDEREKANMCLLHT